MTEELFSVKVDASHGLVNRGFNSNEAEAEIIAQKQSSYESGNLIIALLEGQLIFKRYYKNNGAELLTEPNAEPISVNTKEFEILGKAIKMIIPFA